jgi:hypothetical protein
VTPATVRRGIASRIATATGYTHAEVLLGVTNAPRTAKSPTFDVRLAASTPVESRQRSGSANAHLVRRAVEVRVLSQGNPARDVEQWEAAEVAEQRVRQAVLTDTGDADPLLCIRSSIVWTGADAPEYPDGGAWRLTVIRFTCAYLESLE